MIFVFRQLPFFIQAACLIIALSLAGWLLNAVLLLWHRWTGYREETGSAESEPVFRQLFINQVFLPGVEAASPGTLQAFKEKHLRHAGMRRRFVSDILHYRRLFSGSISQRLIGLYLNLGLDQPARKALGSRQTTSLLLALTELLYMEVPLPAETLERLLTHRDSRVRELARRYRLTLCKQDPFQVFTRLDEPLSGWEQLELFKIITEMEGRKIPNFALWIQEGQEPTLVFLCLKLAVHFQQYDSIPVITELLRSANTTLKTEAINALGKLHQQKAEASIAALYDEETEQVKLEIVKALGRIGSGQHLNLLKQVFDREDSITLRKHAARSIRSHQGKGRQLWDTLRAQGSRQEQVLLNHAENELLKY